MDINIHWHILSQGIFPECHSTEPQTWCLWTWHWLSICKFSSVTHQLWTTEEEGKSHGLPKHIAGRADFRISGQLSDYSAEFPFSETPVRQSMFAEYRRLMKHIKLPMVQQKMTSSMIVLPIPSVIGNSNKTERHHAGWGEKNWWFVCFFKVSQEISYKKGSRAASVISSYYFR